MHVEGTTEENSRLQFQLLGNMEIQGSKLQKRTEESRPGFAEAMVSREGTSRAHKRKGLRVSSTWRDGHHFLECEGK